MLDKFKNMGWKKFYLIYAMCTIGTMASRFLPFMIFNEKRTTPKYITYLGRVLPGAIFSMLIVYCLKNVNVTGYSYGLPELIAIIVTVLLHKWKKQMLVSIAGGTICYMMLVQLVRGFCGLDAEAEKRHLLKSLLFMLKRKMRAFGL